MSRNPSRPHGSSVVVSDVAFSQVIVGDRNFAMQLTLEGGAGYSDRATSPPLHPRGLPVIRARRAAAEPVGRDSVIEQSATALLEGRSVQLCGETGVGKTAVAEAVARRLAAAGRNGTLLAGGEPRAELSPLYTELAKTLFSVDWYAPDETVLRTETARHRPAGVIVVPDCALSAENADRLLGTFPDCVFLLCSRQQTLYTGELVLDLEPLTLDDTRALVERELGRPLDGFENLQVRHVHELSEGRTSRLLVCAAFLRRTAADPRPHGAAPLSPQQQTGVLLTGISEPARRALAALCTFGPAPDALLDALTGLEGTSSAGDELEHAGLAARSGDLLVATDDATAAMRDRGWRANPHAAAAGLTPLLDPRGLGAALLPDRRLCAAVAQALFDDGAMDSVSAFARLAAPAALATGDVASWQRLVTLGFRATSAGGRPENLAYFLTEEHTKNLLRGDRVAAAAALAALATELARHAPGAPVSTPGSPSSAPPKHPASLRRTLQNRFGRGAGSALAIAAPIAAVAVAAAAALTAASVTRPAASSTSQAAGSNGAAGSTSQNSTTALGAAGVYPYSFTGQDTVHDVGGAAPHEIAIAYPTVTGLANASVEQQINAELRAPMVDRVNGVAPSGTGTVPGTNKPDPYTSSTSTQIFQTGDLISVAYTGFEHFSGAGDENYGVTAVTVRTDTGALVPPTGILTAAATTTDLNTLLSDLQAQPGISECDESTGWQGASSLAGAFSTAPADQPPYALNITPVGLLFSFADDAISPTICRPAALLTWSQLAGMVNPQVVQLASSTAPGGPQPTVTLEPSGSAPATPSASGTGAGSSASSSASPAPTGPAGVVLAYYAAINAGNYQQAWNLGGRNLNPDYQSFKNGFQGTSHDAVSILGVSGDTVSISLSATQSAGGVKQFAGTYTVTGGLITSAQLSAAG